MSTKSKEQMSRDILDAQARFEELLCDWFTDHGCFYQDSAVPTLSASQLAGCTLLPGRHELLQALPKNGVVAELGTLRGDFAAKILELATPAKLHIFDLYWARFRHERFEEHVRSGRVELHDGDSAELVAGMPDGIFDWMYIDADHRLEAVKRDIAACVPKLKRDGLLVFNDYTNWSICQGREYGVARAVNEFCKQEGWVFRAFALHPMMYCDVAIQRAP